MRILYQKLQRIFDNYVLVRPEMENLDFPYISRAQFFIVSSPTLCVKAEISLYVIDTHFGILSKSDENVL